MSVLKTHFDASVNQASPVQKDYVRKVNIDADGAEFITYEEVDYRSVQKANGDVSLWKLDSLLKAGINPDFPIHTGNPTRLDGIDVITKAAAIADSILADENKES